MTYSEQRRKEVYDLMQGLKNRGFDIAHHATTQNENFSDFAYFSVFTKSHNGILYIQKGDFSGVSYGAEKVTGPNSSIQYNYFTRDQIVSSEKICEILADLNEAIARGKNGIMGVNSRNHYTFYDSKHGFSYWNTIKQYLIKDRGIDPKHVEDVKYIVQESNNEKHNIIRLVTPEKSYIRYDLKTNAYNIFTKED